MFEECQRAQDLEDFRGSAAWRLICDPSDDEGIMPVPEACGAVWEDEDEAEDEASEDEATEDRDKTNHSLTTSANSSAAHSITTYQATTAPATAAIAESDSAGLRPSVAKPITAKINWNGQMGLRALQPALVPPAGIGAARSSWLNRYSLSGKNSSRC